MKTWSAGRCGGAAALTPHTRRPRTKRVDTCQRFLLPVLRLVFRAVFRPASRAPFRIGYRFFHISNGVIAERNPGLNVSSIYVGTTFGR